MCRLRRHVARVQLFVQLDLMILYIQCCILLKGLCCEEMLVVVVFRRPFHSVLRLMLYDCWQPFSSLLRLLMFVLQPLCLHKWCSQRIELCWYRWIDTLNVVSIYRCPRSWCWMWSHLVSQHRSLIDKQHWLELDLIVRVASQRLIQQLRTVSSCNGSIWGTCLHHHRPERCMVLSWWDLQHDCWHLLKQSRCCTLRQQILLLEPVPT